MGGGRQRRRHPLPAKRHVGRDGRGTSGRGGQDDRDAKLRDLAGAAQRD